MDASTDVGKIIIALKQALKAKGLSNRDVAARLKVSDTTVKRYLRGQGISLSVLQRLAELVDLDLLSLVALARQQSAPRVRMTTTQEEALGKSAILRAVFFHLRSGKSPSRIGAELGLTPQKLDMQMAKLQSLRLIRRVAQDVIDILADPFFEFDAKDQGALTNIARDLARHFLSEIDLRNERSEWFYTAIPMSEASAKQTREMIKRLILEVRKLARNDATLPSREAPLHEFFIAAQPTTRETFLRQD